MSKPCYMKQVMLSMRWPRKKRISIRSEYQSTLPEARLPFIFMNAVGLQRDVETLLHEAGHAFHALATQKEDFYAYRGAPIEFCEVASMSMELLGNEFIEEFYSPGDANRARRVHLEGIAGIFAWIATVDAFQHWIYTHPGHTRAERSVAWLELMDRFGGEVDWTGYDRGPARSAERRVGEEGRSRGPPG